MTVFTVEQREFGWEEIAAAAQQWGEWEPFAAETRYMLACLRYAAATEQMPAAQEAAVAFRYAHNLISAQDTQRWLNRWQMTAVDWMNCLRGQVLCEQWAARLDQIVAAHPVRDDKVAAVIRHFAVCAGKLSEWAQKLAGRAAVVAASGKLDAGDDDNPHTFVARIEAAFEEQCRAIVTAQSVAARIADHRLDWLRFDCSSLWFAEERVAREALWCLTEDGMTPAEVARAARCEVRRQQVYLDEIEAHVRPHFLAARAGEALGPFKLNADDGFPVFFIAAKQTPAADDPRILQRAENAVVAGLIQQAMAGRVHWL